MDAEADPPIPADPGSRPEAGADGPPVAGDGGAFTGNRSNGDSKDRLLAGQIFSTGSA